MNFLKPKFWDKKQVSFFSLLLFPITLFIKFLNFFRRFFIKNYRCTIPVICVGNIYIGGTGKTPLCIELFDILKRLNRKPVFIRKKYKSFQDEIKLLKQIGPVYESSKRIDALKNIVQSEADVAILDDGFQDFSINKNLSIVCFNEKQWIGNGFVIPSGPLRESLSALSRADCVMITGKKNDNVEKIILKENKKIKIFYTKYKAQNIDEFKNKKVIGFAGIGNPVNFFNLLKDNNIDILEEISFPDHYNYSQKELKNLIDKAKEKSVILLTTEKDYLRINNKYRENISYLKIRIDIENKNEFSEQIKKFI